MRRLTVALFATIGLASVAHGADVLPTTKPAPPAPKPNCWASLWNWLDSSPDDCPIGAYGIQLYATLDVGYGYLENGAPFNPSADKMPFGIQKYGDRVLWRPAYNGLSASMVGLKMKEDLRVWLVGDWPG
jgi:hypothetical protein